MSGISGFLTYGLLAIFAENLVMSGGVGSSKMLSAVKKRSNLLVYWLMMFLFTVVGQAVSYPVEILLKDDWAVYLRPAAFVLVISIIYIGVRFPLEKSAKGRYHRSHRRDAVVQVELRAAERTLIIDGDDVKHPMVSFGTPRLADDDTFISRHNIIDFLGHTAFNSVVFAVPFMVSSSKWEVGFFGGIALAAGTAVGFALTLWLVAVGVDRLDNENIPKAFRGTPIQLIYIGLLSLAFSVFSYGNVYI